MNFCLSLSHFPSCWKIAQVVPLFKKGDPLACNNYRPISLLPCISKVFEKILFDHIFDFLKTHSILTHKQSGFIPGDSTINQLLTICQNIAKHIDNGDEVVAVFLDLTKAFDRVWHAGLLHKLQQIGIQGSIHRLLSSYLEHRTQYVSLEGAESSSLRLHAGVPQGSVLGPLLFLVFINDVAEGLQSDAFLFADDTSLFLPIPHNSSYIEAATVINRDLAAIDQWAKRWKVSVHPQKTELMVFTNKSSALPMPQLMLGDQALRRVSSHTHLGVTLTTGLTWGEHIDKVVKKCGRTLGIMKKAKYRWSKDALSRIYTTVVRPTLEYGDIIVDSCNQQQAVALEGIQLEAARVATGAKRGTSHEALLAEVAWEPLKKRRQKHKLFKMHKFLHKALPPHISSIISNWQPRSNTRLGNSFGFIIPRCTTSKYLNSPLLSTAILWNSLPNHTKTEPATNIFKKRIAQMFPHPKPLISPTFATRPAQIAFLQIRMGFSNLKYHLFSKQCIESPLCSCGEVETPDHFFFAMSIILSRTYSSHSPNRYSRTSQ